MLSGSPPRCLPSAPAASGRGGFWARTPRPTASSPAATHTAREATTRRDMMNLLGERTRAWVRGYRSAAANATERAAISVILQLTVGARHLVQLPYTVSPMHSPNRRLLAHVLTAGAAAPTPGAAQHRRSHTRSLGLPSLEWSGQSHPGADAVRRSRCRNKPHGRYRRRTVGHTRCTRGRLPGFAHLGATTTRPVHLARVCGGYRH